VPASHDELGSVFRDLTGHYYSQETWYGEQAGNANEWIDLFSETGIAPDDPTEHKESFEEFLYAFYPQEGMSGDDWWYVRQEFYDRYGVDDHSIDWEAYREAIGYGRD
jgi:hypothetical protein